MILNRRRLTSLLICALGAALAAEPILWLARSWGRATYNGSGGLVFALCAGLFAWSASSERARPAPTRRVRAALVIVACTAALRAAGHLVSISVLSAAALALDVLALGLALDLVGRRRAVGPGWLALLFLFCLPIERIAQRVVGYPLQRLAARGACAALDVVSDDVVCRGLDIAVDGRHVLVDLPCSGARGLFVVAALFLGLGALARPAPRRACGGAILALSGALLANALRIALLAWGHAHAASIGIDPLEGWLHEGVGYATLAIALAPILLWARSTPAPLERHQEVSGSSSRPRDPSSLSSEVVCGLTLGRPQPPRTHTPRTRILRQKLPDGALEPEAPASPSELAAAPTARGARWVAIAASAAAIGALFLPREPLDVSRPIDAIALPAVLAGHRAEPQELGAMEREFFVRHGGAAARARYGALTLLAVRTSAPLRHMHTPDECLGSAGFEVETIGLARGPLPGALYRARDASGRSWRVQVSWVSERGRLATSIAEVVWLWFDDPSASWTALERVTPWDLAPARRDALDAAVRRSLAADHQPL